MSSLSVVFFLRELHATRHVCAERMWPTFGKGSYSLATQPKIFVIDTSRPRFARGGRGLSNRHSANPMMPLLPLGAKSANPMIHTFAAFAALCKKRKSHESYILLPLLPLCAKSANPMIHTSALCKKRKSYFCHFCRFVQKAQIP